MVFHALTQYSVKVLVPSGPAAIRSGPGQVMSLCVDMLPKLD